MFPRINFFSKSAVGRKKKEICVSGTSFPYVTPYFTWVSHCEAHIFPNNKSNNLKEYI